MMDLFESKVEKIMGHIKNNLYANNSLIAFREIPSLPKLLSGELDVSSVQDEGGLSVSIFNIYCDESCHFT